MNLEMEESIRGRGKVFLKETRAEGPRLLLFLTPLSATPRAVEASLPAERGQGVRSLFSVTC
jgi:hypothetical protein